MAVGQGSRRRTVLTAALLGLIMLAGLLLRCHGLSAESAWYDEIVTLKHNDAPDLATFLTRVRADDPSMTPVYFAAEYCWIRLVGDSVTNARMLSVLFGVLCIPVSFLIARSLYGSVAGFVAAFGIAVSVVNVHFAQVIRVYALVTLLGLVSIYTLLKILEGGRNGWWVAHCLVNALIVYTHLFAPLLLIAQGVFLLATRRPSLRKMAIWFSFHALLAMSLLAWVAIMDRSHPELDGFAWLKAPTAEWAASAILLLAGKAGEMAPGGIATSIAPARGLMDAALAGFFVWALTLVVIRAFRARRDSSPKMREEGSLKPVEKLGLLVLWGLFSPLVLVVLSYAWRPCFVLRYFAYCSPPFFILAGGAVAGLRSGARQYAGGGCLALLLCYQLALLLLTPGPVRADWQSLAHFIAAHGAPEEPVLTGVITDQVSVRFNLRLFGAQNPVLIAKTPINHEELGLASVPAFWLVLDKGSKSTSVLKKLETGLDTHEVSANAVEFESKRRQLVLHHMAFR